MAMAVAPAVPAGVGPVAGRAEGRTKGATLRSAGAGPRDVTGPRPSILVARPVRRVVATGQGGTYGPRLGQAPGKA